VQFHGLALNEVSIEEGVMDCFPVVQGYDPQHTRFSVPGVQNLSPIAESAIGLPLTPHRRGYRGFTPFWLNVPNAFATIVHRNSASFSWRLKLLANGVGRVGRPREIADDEKANLKIQKSGRSGSA
jgi:hypothetical protein